MATYNKGTNDISVAPATDAFAITPDDDTDLTFDTRGIYVGVSGNVTIITIDGTTVEFVAVPAGAILPVRARRITEATTADSLVGLI